MKLSQLYEPQQIKVKNRQLSLHLLRGGGLRIDNVVHLLPTDMEEQLSVPDICNMFMPLRYDILLNLTFQQMNQYDRKNIMYHMMQ